MDFLGLKTLTMIDQTIKIVKRTRKEDVDLDTVEQYIPNQGWVTHPPMPVVLQGMASVNVAEKIYVIGGLSHQGLIPINVSYYDPNVIPEFNSTVFFVFILSIILVIYIRFVPRAKFLVSV